MRPNVHQMAVKRGAKPGRPKKTALAKWTPVCVEWEDAYACGDKNLATEHLRTYTPCIRKSIGFLAHLDKNRIMIVGTDDRLANSDGDADDLVVVPTGMVRKITPLRG